MYVMTAKVDLKKIAVILALVAVAIVGIVLLVGGDDSQSTAGASLATNDGRVKFLTDMGWDVVVSPTETGQVKIPEQITEVFERYNALQKSQGYDLTPFAGKTVMRYVYKIKNFPGATDPVYATLLIYKDQVIGGDVTDTSAKGVIQGLLRTAANPTAPSQTTPSTVSPTN